VVGVSQTNPVYQVLLCQEFHYDTGGMVHPVMGRFVYHVYLWNGKDTSILATLEGMQAHSHSSSRTAQVTVAVKNPAGEDTSKRKREEDKLSLPPTKIEWVLDQLYLPTPRTEMTLARRCTSAWRRSQLQRQAPGYARHWCSWTSKRLIWPPRTPTTGKSQWKNKIGQGFWPEVMDC
jgi:hypothetical protein